ncbi:Uncharacterised protein [Vibrio cholerae]|nr:Uncharacterised protein [Vibrio cholerae]
MIGVSEYSQHRCSFKYQGIDLFIPSQTTI